jgi:nucleoside phosphorylase
MNVLVTFALRFELAPWLRRRPFRRAKLGRYPCYETTLAGATVRALLTGVGPAHAQAAMRAALATRPDAVLASGLSGGLKPSLDAGEVIAPRIVRSTDADHTLTCSPHLLDLAVRCGAQAVAAFISTTTIARTREAKAALSNYADAVDMESFPILAEALHAGLPALALRCVSDSSRSDLPCDFSRMLDARGQLNPWQLALEPLRNPKAIPSLLRFARAGHRAAVRLAQFIDVYLEHLAGKTRYKCTYH